MRFDRHAHKHRAEGIGLWLLVAFLLIAGILMLLVFSLPYEREKLFIDSLARDGSVESFTPGFHLRFSLTARVAGIILVILGAAAAFGRRTVYRLSGRVLDLINETRAELASSTRGLLRDIQIIKSEGRSLYAVVAITLFGALVRVPFLLQPMGHDEAYTIAAYGVAYFRDIISDYWLTNNHIFHSLLVSLCYHLIGYQPWSVRLPVFIAGVLVIPAAYLLARMLYDRASAMVGAVAVACMPLLIYYSTTARGYIITALLTLITFALGEYVRRQKSLAAWLLIALLSALGFYTIPIMLYPFGILCTWLLLSAIFRDIPRTYGGLAGFLKYLMACSVTTMALTLILYLPVIFNTGFSPTKSDYLTAQPWGFFLDNLKLRMANTWIEFNMDLAPSFGYLIIIGFISSLILHWRISKVRVPVQLAAIVWLGISLAVYRIDPWPKIWTFLLPLLAIWTAAGIISPLRWIPRLTTRRINTQAFLSALFILGAAIGGAARSMNNFSYLTGKKGDVEATVVSLKAEMRPGDLYIVSWPDDASFWYYVKLHGIPHDHIDRSKPFTRTLVLVNEHAGQTLETVMLEQGPDLFLFEMEAAEKIMQNGAISVYELIPDQRLIEKIYGQ